MIRGLPRSRIEIQWESERWRHFLFFFFSTRLFRRLKSRGNDSSDFGRKRGMDEQLRDFSVSFRNSSERRKGSDVSRPLPLYAGTFDFERVSRVEYVRFQPRATTWRAWRRCCGTARPPTRRTPPATGRCTTPRVTHITACARRCCGTAPT